MAIDRPHSQYGSAINCYVGYHCEYNITNRHQQLRDPESRPKRNLSDVKPLSHRIVRLLDRAIGCYLTNVPSAMFATIASSDRILRSVFLPGGRSSYDSSYAGSRDQQRLEKIVRLVVALNDRSYDRSWPPTIDRMINSVGHRMGSDLNPRNISTFYSVSEQPIGGITGRKVARPVARLIVRPLTIWNSRFQVLNMTIDLVATDLPIAITYDLCHQSYDLCHQSYVLSTIGPFFGRR